MRCDYVTLNSGRQLHYRTQGCGPALIILHPSPQNSETMIPAINAFSEVCTCIAFDTPGYGLSDPLPIEAPEISDYAAAIVEAASAMGLEKFMIFGAATGAIVTIEIAKNFPEKVHMAMADSYGHMEDAERVRTLDGYMPSVAARRDGGHLFTYWDMCHHLFDAFPWHSGKAEDRLDVDLPPAAISHDVMLRYLQAGEGYTAAYLPAMHKENRAHFDGLTVPTTLMRWQDSVVVNLTDAMIDQNLPACVQVLRAGPGVEARFSVQRDVLKAKIEELALADFEIVRASPQQDGKIAKRYFGAGELVLHGLAVSAPSGNPIVFLHGAGKSASQMIEYASPYFGSRPIYILDMPGHGASAPISDLGAIETYSVAVAAIVAELGPLVDLVGEGIGGAAALVIAQKLAANKTTISKVTLIDPIQYSEDERARFEAMGLPDLAPQNDASHLAKAWSMVRDDALFWPWFDRSAKAKRKVDADLSPANLHQKAVDILRLAGAWRDVAKLEVDINWSDLISKASDLTQVEVQVTERHPCPDRPY